MSSGSTGYDTKTYEHIKYWYDTQAWLPKNAVIVNRRSWDALDPATQAAVTKAAAEAEARGWKISQEKNEWYKKALAEKGMKIMPPPPKLMTDMRQVGAIMLTDWEKTRRARWPGCGGGVSQEVSGRCGTRPSAHPACGNTAQTTSPGLLGATSSSFLARPTSISRGSVTPFFTARISAITLTAISGGVLLPM